MRYFIVFSFNGQNFCGYQIQPNGVSIQETIEKGLSKILSEKIKITGCGRTDAGVHAKEFYAHFDSNNHINQNLIYKLNSYFSHDIAFHKIFLVNDDAHARFDALSRTYKYFITDIKDPFNYNYCTYIRGSLNIDIMNDACKILKINKDFTSFSKLHTDVNNNFCKIFEAYWENNENQFIFTIEANRFLRNMVRSIVGTMVDIGRGKLNIRDFEKIINEKNRQSASTSFPAKGLFLWKVKY